MKIGHFNMSLLIYKLLPPTQLNPFKREAVQPKERTAREAYTRWREQQFSPLPFTAPHFLSFWEHHRPPSNQVWGRDLEATYKYISANKLYCYGRLCPKPWAILHLVLLYGPCNGGGRHGLLIKADMEKSWKGKKLAIQSAMFQLVPIENWLYET